MVDLKFLEDSVELEKNKKISNITNGIDLLPYYDYDDNNIEDAFNHFFLKFPFVSNDMGHFLDYANKEELLEKALEIYIPSRKDITNFEFEECDDEELVNKVYNNLSKYEKQLEEFKQEIREVLK